MAFAVSDVASRAIRGRRLRAPGTDSVRRSPPALSLHWPRVIALGLNTLAWVLVISVIRLIVRH